MPNSISPTDTATSAETTSADSVTQLYAGFLNRAPDPAGAAYWTAQLQGGTSLDQISQAFAGQTEAASQSAFLANPDVTDTTAVKAFVDGVYSNLFSRAADEAGEAYWIGQLQSGASTPGGAVLSIASGAQGSDLLAITNKVAVANYLDTQIVNNNVAFSMDSAKAAMAAATSDPSSVAAAQSIVDAYVTTTPHTMAAGSHTEVAATPTSAETSPTDSIAQLYAGYLNRAPDPAGAAYWAGQLQGGTSLDQISQAFSGQAEAAAQNAFLANPDVTDAAAVKGFVDAIYSNLFSRAADVAGEAYWIGQLQSGGSTIGAAVLSIMSGAQGNDLATISNKAAVANYLDAQIVSNNVAFSMDSAKAAMAAATSDPSSVAAAQSIVDAYVKTAPHAMADGSHPEVTVVGVSASHDPGHSV